MKYYLNLDENNNVIGYDTSEYGGGTVTIEIEELPPYIIKGYKFVNGVLIKNDKYEALVAQDRITMLKDNLTNTDYQAIKYAEGQITEEEYAQIKAQRQAWREEINKLEEECDLLNS